LTRRTRKSDAVLTVEGCVVMLADASVLSASPNVWSDSRRAGEDARLKAGDEPWMTLFHMNDQLHQREARGEILTWALVVGGRWRARLRVVDGEPPELTKRDELDCLEGDSDPDVVKRSVSRLVLPTGELRFIDNHSVNVEAASLEPGEYVVEFLRNFWAEHNGYALGDEPTALPDPQEIAWRFRFWRVGDAE